MITAGDERGRTQRGNNNAYCQDNEISWVDWDPEHAWDDVLELTRAALRLRREHPALCQRHHFAGTPTLPGGPKDLAWIHPEGREMSTADWYDDRLHALGMFVSGDPLRSPGPRGEQLRDKSFLLWVNSYGDSRQLRLPENEWITAGEVVLSTDDGHRVGDQVAAGTELVLGAHSVLLMRQL
jgi:glycogen operon protein